jgi:F-type H+-transporting ATPase subunit epsilon
VNIEIITPEKRLFEGEVQSIKVPGRKGEFQVLTDHAPIVSTLGVGLVTITEPGGKQTLFNIDGGIVEIKQNKIILLVERVKE